MLGRESKDNDEYDDGQGSVAFLGEACQIFILLTLFIGLVSIIFSFESSNEQSVNSNPLLWILLISGLGILLPLLIMIKPFKERLSNDYNGGLRWYEALTILWHTIGTGMFVGVAFILEQIPMYIIAVLLVLLNAMVGSTFSILGNTYKTST